MINNISFIALPEAFNGYQGADGSSLTELGPISRVNIFVGANNSSKSRFLRTLATLSDYVYQPSIPDLKETNNRLKSKLREIEAVLKSEGVESADQLNRQSVQKMMQSLPEVLSLNRDVFEEHRKTVFEWHHLREDARWTYSDRRNPGPTTIRNVSRVVQPAQNELVRILSTIPEQTVKIKRVYIPMLRGLRPLNAEHTDFYHARTQEDYFKGKQEAEIPEIFTGLSLYPRIRQMLLGSNSQRKSIQQYQDFISSRLFEGRTVTLIPSEEKGVVVAKIGKEEERPIHELGDGIQSAIILSFLPFIYSEPTFFFIEEPEVHLHPGLQRKVVEFYSRDSIHKFFFTTHSNHLLDITMDVKGISIFTFRKHLDLNAENDEQTPSFTVETVDSGHRSSLELLEARNSSVLLVNATIWIEGITDRLYFRAMLASYIEHLESQDSLDLRVEEDVHYSFVEYGGANISHWSFLDSEHPTIEVDCLCGRALVIVDQDGDSKLSRKEKLEEKLQDRLIILPAREVENLLPYHVLRTVVSQYEKNPALPVEEFNYSDYQNLYLGRFIELRMLKGTFQRLGGYQAKTGTIRNKVDFCEKALPHIQYSELPTSTRAIIQRIYEFIVTQNR